MGIELILHMTSRAFGSRIALGGRADRLTYADLAAAADGGAAVLRGSGAPDDVVFRNDLPYTPTGKLLRRELARQLS